MPKGYDNVTKILHWLIFLAVASQYAVGEFMPHIGRKIQEVGLVWVHMFLGGIVLALIVVAIAWRLTHPALQLPELPPWQRVSATLTHWALYLSDPGDDRAGLGGRQFPRLAGHRLRCPHSCPGQER